MTGERRHNDAFDARDDTHFGLADARHQTSTRYNVTNEIPYTRFQREVTVLDRYSDDRVSRDVCQAKAVRRAPADDKCISALLSFTLLEFFRHIPCASDSNHIRSAGRSIRAQQIQDGILLLYQIVVK